MAGVFKIDGSLGEGGGQILRTAVGVAAVMGNAIHVEKIRAGRKKPGLMRQHLTAVNAAAQICGARVEGNSAGSMELSFSPGEVKSGDYHFSIGTAGSATLVLQTVLPMLLTAKGPSRLILEGGTHNLAAPPFEFLASAFLPLVNRMGPTVQVALERYGFFPAGGGRIVVNIQPVEQLSGFDLCERGPLLNAKARVLISNLPMNIAEREARRLKARLPELKDQVRIEPVPSAGPGNIVIVECQFQNVTEVATAFGRLGTSAETVANEASGSIRDYLKSDCPVGENLSDQILLPLALSAAGTGNASSQRGGSFRTRHVSGHLKTHIAVLQQLLPVRIHEEQESDGLKITVRPAACDAAL
ncbi:MAG: RNA 3'-terminal phosphate cyclase [Planctomycetaceae bacterium]|nr:RNA 3'-terminal phosphate cyclase [Planctomycetaceae bacterium]